MQPVSTTKGTRSKPSRETERRSLHLVERLLHVPQLLLEIRTAIPAVLRRLSLGPLLCSSGVPLLPLPNPRDNSATVFEKSFSSSAATSLVVFGFTLLASSLSVSF